MEWDLYRSSLAASYIFINSISLKYRAACKGAVGKRIKISITVAWENGDYNIPLPINRLFCSQKPFVAGVSEARANPSATERSWLKIVFTQASGMHNDVTVEEVAIPTVA